MDIRLQWRKAGALGSPSPQLLHEWACVHVTNAPSMNPECRATCRPANAFKPLILSYLGWSAELRLIGRLLSRNLLVSSLPRNNPRCATVTISAIDA